MSHLIAPSILSADFGNLQRDIEMINRSQADWFHVDVMDGVFVPNISFGMPVIHAVKKHATKPLDVHLMIVDPDRYIPAFKKSGADILTVHIEACNHLHRTIQFIKQEGMKAGVAINPHTPVSALREIAKDIDLLLVMSVNPGFGGQSFIERSLDKIREAKIMREETGASYQIEVDGGVSLSNIKQITDAGADVLVAGNAVFAATDPMDMIGLLKAV
jgi:ribulose-phosphate 3-epimerase